MWGLNSVLRDDTLNLKNREDHRHHAVDALVIALTNRSRLQQLAKVRYTDKELPAPWPNFYSAVEELIGSIKVSHRAVRDLSGALHDETIYGPTSKPRYKSDQPRPHAQGWIEQDGVFVLRKKLEDLTSAMIDDIRDPQVKSLVVERLKYFGIEPGGKGKIPKDVWKEPLLMVRQGKRKSHSPSLIKKVRILRKDGTIHAIRSGTAYIKPGNTHHIALFELSGSTPEKPKRALVPVSMIEAARRIRFKLPVINRKHPTIADAKFLFSLGKGELVWGTFQGREGLYKYVTCNTEKKQMFFVFHTDARKTKTSPPSAYPNTLNAVKITVDPLGRIRNAND
jgi:CRISPR-associated endonuclease Csn1